MRWDSTPGKGTTFTVMFPMKIEAETMIEETFPQLKILVADDDAIMCEYTLEMLGSMGIHADCVNDGAQAVARVRDALQARKKL